MKNQIEELMKSRYNYVSKYLNSVSPGDDCNMMIKVKASEIKRLRKALKWTCRKLAEKTGIHYNTIYRWENGRCKPSKLALRQMEPLKKRCLAKSLFKRKKRK